ncbi:hypothetical protein MN116_008812 [Schistosoma mekongi]|uniref:Cystatin domain-containing protein n=1 Tax=Schistosoma mekongi TaxID=38744 RepID=A0AAE1Z5U2_SCHME|nr:hypothetical protein MN116_008812 [Schistosoma mekongi]
MNSFNLAIVLIANVITLQSCTGFSIEAFQRISEYTPYSSLNQSLIKQSILLANKMSNSFYWFTHNNISNTTTQIVAGLMFPLQLTSCTNKLYEKVNIQRCKQYK